MSPQEQERRRVAEGVHDDSLQAVFAVGLGLANLKRRVEDQDTVEALERSYVDVSLTERDGRHVICVRDDGVGFNPAEALRQRPGHLGLAALTERLRLAGGVLRIDSAPDAGATVEF